jgi:hypothetical protein
MTTADIHVTDMSRICDSLSESNMKYLAAVAEALLFAGNINPLRSLPTTNIGGMAAIHNGQVTDGID